MNTGKKSVLMTLLAEVLNVLFSRSDVLMADLWRVVQPQTPWLTWTNHVPLSCPGFRSAFPGWQRRMFYYLFAKP